MCTASSRKVKAEMSYYALHLVGLSHHTAPIELRERLTFSPAELAHTLATGRTLFPELTLLSTCNRLELYAYAENGAQLRDFLAHQRQICLRRLEPHLYHAQDIDVVRHLGTVATGLDSMVLGEAQILGQVTSAWETALAHQTAGTHLNLLFRTAIRMGKRARTETAISRHPVSISSAAINLLARQLPSLAEKLVVIVGAGEMARLALKYLQTHGCQKIIVANRRPERAQLLADQFGVQIANLEALPLLLAEADVLITATSAPEVIITQAMITTAREEQQTRPLYLVDLAVPRDIDPTAGQLPNVHLFDVDDLRTQIDAGLQERQEAVPQVEKIIQEELERFTQQWREATVRPLISDLHQYAEEIRQKELTRTLRFLPADLDPNTRQHIEHLTQSLITKLLHEPTKRLRASANLGQADDHVESLRYLFSLSAE